jgi:hypothetical protein
VIYKEGEGLRRPPREGGEGRRDNPDWLLAMPSIFPPSFDASVLESSRWPLILIGVVVLLRVLLPRSSVRTIELWREVVIVVSAYFCYFLVRGFVAGHEFEAFNRAADLISLERAMGIFWEVDLQGHVQDIGLLENLANWVYVWGHWPVIIPVSVWLFLRHRDDYYIYRNAFLISGAVGLVIFSTLPVAPPRFMPAWGFVDTAQAYHSGPSAALLVNEYAAMPSLHFGWNLLVGTALFRHGEWLALRAVGAVLPPAMFLSIVLTGNHYFLDGIAGGAVCLLALVAAIKLRDHLQDRRSRPDMPRASGLTPA